MPLRSRRYELSRQVLRQMLSQKIGVSPLALEFGLTEYKKPILLTAAPTSTPWYFSISHSQNMSAIAIANTPIGIDIEHTTLEPEEVVIPLFVRADEKHLLKTKSDFYQLWCLKEAILKALGTGLHTNPLEVQLKPLATPYFEAYVNQQRYMAQSHMLSSDIQMTVAQPIALSSYEIKVLELPIRN